MRLLKFNNEIVDIDEKTAIGIDYQAYDIKEPGYRKVSISNNFNIPKTARNMYLLGFAGNPQSISQTIYNFITVNYYNDNKHLIKNGNARITEIGERISVMVYEKEAFWALMGDFLWPNVQQELLTWLQTEKSLPSAVSPFVGTFQQFIEEYINTTEGIILPFYISNLAQYSPDEITYLEDTSTLWLKYHTTGGAIYGLGGHFAVYCKTICEFIQYKYSVDLSVLATTYDYNIFEDVIASALYVPCRNISIEYTLTGFYFSYDAQGSFLPEDSKLDKESKSLYDFIRSYFQMFNALIDRIPTTDLSDKFIVRRFDDIYNAPVIDFSGGMSGNPVFKPILDNYKQVNYIKFDSIYEGGDKLTNAKKISCGNKNIDAGGADESLFSIDAFIPGSLVLGGDVCPDLSNQESFKTFTFLISDQQASATIKAQENGDERTASVVLNVAKTYSLDSEYNTIMAMALMPKLYTIKKWLKLNQIDKIVYFAKYWIKELNGYYFINKISGYNPQKSKDPTTIEVIKIINPGN